MRKSITLIGLTLLLAFAAVAQEKATQMETFLGYTFTRFSPVTDIPSFHANGGSGQFAYNFNSWIGGVVDAGAVYDGNIHRSGLDSTLTNFLIGPRVTARRWSRFTPYVQTLFGGVYAASSTAVNLGGTPVVTPHGVLTDGILIPSGSFLRLNHTNTGFAMTAGGGLDIKISKHVSFRPVQLEYFLTRLWNPLTDIKNNQNNLRYSAGFNFTFGEER